ncbi:MAG: lysine exporter LysO family protein [Clostridia bacterium]|nr:lysine exporter LysO family protein [Clostridia bacterium]
MTLVIMISLLAGGLAGYFFIPQETAGSIENASMYALYALIFLIGIEIGINKNAFRNIRIVGKRIVLVTVSIIIGTWVGGVIAGFIYGMPKSISLAIASGFGWYSLSGVLLKEMGGAEIGTIAFITNVSREIIAFLTIPWLAKKLSYNSAIAPAGATSMDTTLPVITRYTDDETALVSFGNGLILSMLVPILVPVMYGLPIK